jgi:hypothetical protein
MTYDPKSYIKRLGDYIIDLGQAQHLLKVRWISQVENVLVQQLLGFLISLVNIPRLCPIFARISLVPLLEEPGSLDDQNLSLTVCR